MEFQEDARKKLGEHVFQHVLFGDVKNLKSLASDTLSKKVVPGVNLFLPGVMLGVLGKSLGPFINWREEGALLWGAETAC
jgi:hypothetical protein